MRPSTIGQRTQRTLLFLVGVVATSAGCDDDASGLPGAPASSTSGAGGQDGAGATTSGDAASATSSATGMPELPAEPCPKEGGQGCGGNGIGGAKDTLYVCKSGAYVVDHVCASGCEVMPNGVPDRCAEDVAVPKALVDVLDVKPYVEGSCKPTNWQGWPYDAKECTYSAGGITTTVTVANPAPERVAQWIADASTFIPSLWRLRTTSPDTYVEGLVVIAKHTLGQSSRIFPLEGGVIENMGGGYVNYPFSKGVTEGCSGGCYCRINSLHRTDYCAYVAFLGETTAEACLTKVGTSGHTAGWTNQCLENHIASWTAPKNEHFRARAHQANQQVKVECGNPGSCTPSRVLAEVVAAYD